MIARDLKMQGKKVHEVVDRYKRDARDVVMTPKDFARALKRECATLAKSGQLKDDSLTLLVHYLVREELGMVSFNKLFQALNQKDTDYPLPQD